MIGRDLRVVLTIVLTNILTATTSGTFLHEFCNSFADVIANLSFLIKVPLARTQSMKIFFQYRDHYQTYAMI